MKRDMNLIRDLLLFYESDCSIPKPAADGTTTDEHIIMLIDAGLVFGTLGVGCIDGPMQFSPMDGRTIAGKGVQHMMFPLTWAGHDFIAAARDQNIWNKAVKSIGTMTFKLAKEYLEALIRESIGMRP
jgi:hypothetical protein